jgi:transposase
VEIQKDVQRAWRSLSSRRRRLLRNLAQASLDAQLRCRCKIIVNLVRGNSPQLIHQVLQCSVSQVYRIAERFVEEGESGLADRREDNGDPKVNEDYE